MKLKEKLAEKDPNVLLHNNPLLPRSGRFVDPHCKAAYLAGFDKAREMAAYVAYAITIGLSDQNIKDEIKKMIKLGEEVE